MKPNKTKGRKGTHLPSAVELALHKLAQRVDIRSPQSDEDVVEMLNSQDLSNVPQPDPGRFERLIQERLQGTRPAPKRPEAVRLVKQSSGPPPLPASFAEFRRRLQKGKAGYFTAVQVDRLIGGVTHDGAKLQPHDLPIGWRFSRLGEEANCCLPLEEVYRCLVKAGKIQPPTSRPKPKGGEPVVTERMVNLRQDFWAFKAERN
jgi:hypothetical protein